MEEQILFKTTALGGFEKKAVLAYIDELTAKHHAELAQKEERINSLFAEKQEASHRASESQSLVNSLTGQLQEAQKKLEELEQKLANQERETNIQKTVVKEKDQEIRAQAEKCRQLQFQVETLDRKSKKFDEAAAQVGALLVDARSTAQSIIAEAKAEADALREETARSAKGMEEEILRFQKELGGLRTALGELTQQAVSRLNEVDSLADTVLSHCAQLIGEEEAELSAQEECVRL